MSCANKWGMTMPARRPADVTTPSAAARRFSYRSDWPEIGVVAPWAAPPMQPPASGDWLHTVQDVDYGTTLRLRALPNDFELRLYGLVFNELRLEIAATGAAPPALDTDATRRFLDEAIATYMAAVDERPTYAHARTVAGEPLHAALRRAGFEDVEHRRLYHCRIGDLGGSATGESARAVRYLSLAQVAPEHRASWHERILSLCMLSFRSGSSRHFRDPLLASRLPGSAYIGAVMKLNFEHVPAQGFLLAVDEASDELAGFSVVGQKSTFDPQQQTFTQLLSAVGEGYRGHGVYRGLSRLLHERFPHEACLLNVTHVQNHAIQRAYRDSGRTHVADTAVLRRVLSDSR